MLADEDISTEWNRDVKFERGELTGAGGKAGSHRSYIHSTQDDLQQVLD